MTASTRLRTLPKTKPQIRDIERPVYPRRVAVEVTGIDRDVLRQWQFRGLLDDANLDGTRIHQREDGTRRFYSTLDLLKLSLLQVMTTAGAPVALAVTALPQIGMMLSGEDRAALAEGKPAEYPLLFAQGDEGLELLWFKSLSGAYSSHTTPQQALIESQAYVGFLLDWAALSASVIEQVKELEERWPQR